MQMQLAIFDPTTNILLADWSTRVKSCSVRTGAHGYESCEAELNVPFYEAFLYYQQLGPLKLRVVWGSYRVWEGRLEDPTQFTTDNTNGLKLTAFGGWVAFNDTPYTALWSNTKLDALSDVSLQGAEARQKFSLSISNNQIYVTAQKGAILAAGENAGYTYSIPDDSTRNLIGISVDIDFTAPAALLFILKSFDSTGTGIANDIVIAGTGAQILSSYNVVFGANVASFSAFLFNTTGAPYAIVGETGANYVKLSNLRVVTSNTNRINTTLGTNIAAGTRTVTPASMARIFVGQRLQIDQGVAGVGESVIVTAITATTFTAVFAFAHVIASTVHALVVYPDEIIKDCVSTLNTLNSTQVSSDVASVQSQAIDIDQAVFEDQYPTEIINQLIAKSDNQTPPRQWVAAVFDNQTLIVRPRGSGLAWYTDITSLEVVRTLTQLYNSVYVVYSDASNKRALRTAVTTDADSTGKFKITRRKAIKADTSDSVQALKIRDSVLALQTDPVPRASIELDRIFDKYGNPFPLFMVKADDTLTIRNLPPVLGTVYDKIRTLVIVRTNVDLLRNTIQLDLETSTPNIEVQLAQALKGNTS